MFEPSTNYLDCSPYDTCVALDLKATQDCLDSVYVEANVLDSSGTVIDYTNATLGSLETGDKGRVILGTDRDGASSFKLTKLDCE
jgi:hypothetical protein